MEPRDNGICACGSRTSKSLRTMRSWPPAPIRASLRHRSAIASCSTPSAVIMSCSRKRAICCPRPVCYPEHGFYMVPMANGLRAAGTVELGGLAAPLNPRRTAMIRDGVKMLLPAAGHGSDEWLGFRPSIPGSLPVIGSSRRLPRVTYAFGHGHLGLTLSALTSYLVSQLVAGQRPAVDLAPLRPDRF
nr:FAD-binding oxidoreductase [Rhizobium leguminosarum]